MNKGIVFLMVVLLVLLAVFGGWKLLADFQYKKGVQAYEEFSYYQASQIFAKVKDSPRFLGNVVNDAGQKYTEIQDYQSLLALEEEQDFAHLDAEIGIFLERYPESNAVPYVNQMYRVNRFNFAISMVEAGNVEKADDLLQQVRTDNTFSPEQQEYALRTLADIYQIYSDQLETDDYKDRIQALLKSLEYSNTAGNADYSEDLVWQIKSLYSRNLSAIVEIEANWPLIQDTWLEFSSFLEENDPKNLKAVRDDYTEDILAWAARSEMARDPSFALEQYEYLADLSGFSSVSVSGKITELTIKLGNYDLDQGLPDEALSAYFSVIDDYLSATELETLEVFLSADAIQFLYEEGLPRSESPQQTANILRSIILIDAGQEDEFKAIARFNLGTAYLDSKDYLSAIDYLLESKEITSDPELKQKISSTLSEVVYQVSLLEDDLGELVQKAVANNLMWRSSGGINFPYCNYAKTFCLSQEQYDVLKSSIGLNNTEKLIAYSSDYSDKDKLADSPAEAYYYVNSTTNNTRLQTCYYSQNGSSIFVRELYREREDVIIRVYDLRNGYLLTSRTFPGGLPNACPDSLTFSTPSITWTGDDPDQDEIRNWVSSVCTP